MAICLVYNKSNIPIKNKLLLLIFRSLFCDKLVPFVSLRWSKRNLLVNTVDVFTDNDKKVFYTPKLVTVLEEEDNFQRVFTYICENKRYIISLAQTHKTPKMVSRMNSYFLLDHIVIFNLHNISFQVVYDMTMIVKILIHLGLFSPKTPRTANFNQNIHFIA